VFFTVYEQICFLNLLKCIKATPNRITAVLTNEYSLKLVLPQYTSGHVFIHAETLTLFSLSKHSVAYRHSALRRSPLVMLTGMFRPATWQALGVSVQHNMNLHGAEYFVLICNVRLDLKLEGKTRDRQTC
jgi:hypothetical protein